MRLGSEGVHVKRPTMAQAALSAAEAALENQRIGGLQLPVAALCTLALICMISGTARAADAAQCRNGSFAAQEAAFGLAKVIGAPRTYLRSDMPPCPDDSTACRGRAYVVPGDTVLTGTANRAYVCAF